jgi:hypothetical protein
MGEPCSVTVVTTKSRDGTAEYDNIASLAPIPAKFKAGIGEARITPVIGDCDDDSNPATQALYGLAKFIWEKRIDMPTKVTKAKPKGKEYVAPVDLDSVPY